MNGGQRVAGWSMIAVAILLSTLANAFDAVAHFQTWGEAMTPHFVGMTLKQTALLLLAATGGKMLPQFRNGTPDGS